MYKICPKGRTSFWQNIAFLLMYDFFKKTGCRFTRKELMCAENIEKAFTWLKLLQYDEIYPKHAESTLQRTIQNLRDKGFIIFHGEGNYELTHKGVEECKKVKKELNI